MRLFRREAFLRLLHSPLATGEESVGRPLNGEAKDRLALPMGRPGCVDRDSKALRTTPSLPRRPSSRSSCGIVRMSDRRRRTSFAMSIRNRQAANRRHCGESLPSTFRQAILGPGMYLLNRSCMGRAIVSICEQCGADAVGTDGVCGNCGWQLPDSAPAEDDAISLGETRAADVPPAQARSGTSLPRLERTSQMPYFTPGSPVAGRGLGTQTSTSRYCGTCGARVAAGEAFCGQCGTPVGGSSADFGTSLNVPGAGPARYHVGMGWSDGEGDAPTEAFGVSQGSRYPYAGGTPYAQMGYGREAQGAGASSSSRTIRIVAGVLCLAGSLVSAIAAVILAVH